MSSCQKFSLDKIFERFKVIEFPRTLVGLSATTILDIGINLNTTAYVKTFCEGKLMKFEDAREISASHRAYELTEVDDHTLKIVFTPTNECISKAKKSKNFHDRFVIDIHIINATQMRCCDSEQHSEVGRYYICGLFEHCHITHSPDIIDLGQIPVYHSVSKVINIKNESKYVTCKLKYFKVPTITVTPDNFVLPPEATQDICIYLKPSGSEPAKCITLQILNNIFTRASDENSDNVTAYIIPLKYNTKFLPRTMTLKVESLHKLCERNLLYTYTDDEFIHKSKHRKVALLYLNCNKVFSKKTLKNLKHEHECDNKMICWPSESKKLLPSSDFCKTPLSFIRIFELFDLILNPFFIDFGKVEMNSYGVIKLKIINNSKYIVLITFLRNDRITYTEKQKSSIALKVKPYQEHCINVNCFGQIEGVYKGTFEYSIDNKFYSQHPYRVHVKTPTLVIKDTSLKFGMVSSDNYISSVPIILYNFFNKSVEFQWDIPNIDIPFQVIPRSGSVPGHTCKICDVRYLCKPTRTKTHEIELISVGSDKIPVELNIYTRKHAIKCLETAVHFNDVPLNLEVIEKVNIENSSREFAVFNVVDTLIPGFAIEPMQGIIKPRMITTICIKIKIPYILEMSLDINIKINNKETIILPVTANIVEPKIVINPKNIYMTRIPSYLICYVPITLQNTGTTKALIRVLNTENENMFKLYVMTGNERELLSEHVLEAGETITAFVKVFDVFRREYDLFLPFQVNDLIGPPTSTHTTDMLHYIKQYEKAYECISKFKCEKHSKTISYCRIEGVITLPWIEFSQNTFEFEKAAPNNKIQFTMTNVSKCDLPITICLSKLSPNFSLKHISEDSLEIQNTIKFELYRGIETLFYAEFHPNEEGRFVAVAEIYIDKYLPALPFSNLTFVGNHKVPVILPSTYLVVFPPCSIGSKVSRCIELTVDFICEIETFSFKTNSEHISVNFIKDTRTEQNFDTQIAEICLECDEYYIGKSSIYFYYGIATNCEIEVQYCFTACPLTLHANEYVDMKKHPYPYYPHKDDEEMFNYMNVCTDFLERWLYQQGFRKEFYPIIPDSFHVISTALSSQVSHKSKGISVSYLNFIRRIAGPLVKQIKKQNFPDSDGKGKYVNEIYDIYSKIILLLNCRGADIWFLQPQYLLRFDQFKTYCADTSERNKSDLEYRISLLKNEDLFYRLNKQCWIDFIIQTYKVFVLDFCLLKSNFNTHQGNIVQILVEWYNTQINSNFYELLGKKQIQPNKVIKNITTDLSDGVAIVAAILNYCPFFKNHFSIFIDVEENNTDESYSHKIHNTCLIIEALNEMKLNFPLSSTDLLRPNFLQILLLSVHLFILLPSFIPKETLIFNPILSESSVIKIALNTYSSENLAYSFAILNNENNAFHFEKVTSTENIKRIYLNIKYSAFFIKQVKAILIVQGYNKTKIFDTYLVFYLEGYVGSLVPDKKCKVVCPLYRPHKANIFLSSPFEDMAVYKVCILDEEPTLTNNHTCSDKDKFLVHRLNLIENSVQLRGRTKENNQDQEDQKISLNIICMSKQIANNWLWFKSNIGEFFIKVTTHPRVDLALEILHANLNSWPVEPCSCGLQCECYRTTVVNIPHRSEVSVKCLRLALTENASETMMIIFDELIGSETGNIIIGMLLEEGGSNMANISHTLQNEIKYFITSRGLKPRVNTVTLYPFTDAVFSLPIALTAFDPTEKYSITLTSECGMDVRTYRIFFEENKSDYSGSSD